MSKQISIFLSAATADLEQYRISLRDRLIRGNIDAVEQKHFGLTDRTLVEKLLETIQSCDYVICLIGHKSGHVASKPALELIKNYECFTEESSLLSQYEAATNPATISYTQLEFFIAKALQRTTYLFKLPNESDSAEFGTLLEDTSQQLFRQWLQDANFDYVRFSNEVELENEAQTVLLPTLNPTQRIINLPYQPLGELFLGRDEFLIDLHKELTSNNPTTVIGAKSQPTTVHGSGGIGKTRVAIEYAWHYRDHYSALLFVTAESAQQLDSNLAELSSILPLDIDSIEAQSDVVKHFGTPQLSTFL